MDYTSAIEGISNAPYSVQALTIFSSSKNVIKDLSFELTSAWEILFRIIKSVIDDRSGNNNKTFLIEKAFHKVSSKFF